MPELTLSSLSEFTVLRADPELCDVETALEHQHFANVTDLLIATPDQDARAQLENLFREYDWRVQSLHSCAAAREFLMNNLTAVAVCAEEFPDGSWTELGNAAHQAHSPALIVIAENRSALLDVMNAGGFDIITLPFQREDVLWSIASAWHAWMTRYEQCMDRLQETGGDPQRAA